MMQWQDMQLENQWRGEKITSLDGSLHRHYSCIGTKNVLLYQQNVILKEILQIVFAFGIFSKM